MQTMEFRTDEVRGERAIHATRRRQRLGRATLRVLALAVAASLTAAANENHGAGTTPAGITERLAAIFAEASPSGLIGFAAAETRHGAMIFEHQGRTPLKPASVLKLFTTAAALDHLGPDFRYETQVYLVNQELWVIGAGDPGLGDQRLAEKLGKPVDWAFQEWGGRLSERGVSELRAIVLSDDVFDGQGRHEDWPAAQSEAWYQAPVGGLNYNDNCLDAVARVANGRVELRLTPRLPDSFVRNSLSVGKKHAPTLSRAPDSDLFLFKGSLARSDSFAPISVHRPTVFFGHALAEALAARGIRCTNGVLRRASPPTASAPARAELIATHVTPLRDVLWRCNAFSQNMFAECVLKSLQAYGRDGRRCGEPGSWAGGVQALTGALQRLGIPTDGAIFRDGSGLSHENRVSAGQIVALLTAMARHQQRELWIESLAEAGEDGTLRRRFASLKGRLRAKTGTIAGVSALAGYVTREDGELLAFALLVNSAAPAKLQERVIEALARP